MNAGFLAEFADRRFLGFLAVVDSALRHLPRLARRIEPLADEDTAVAVGEHHARAGAVRSEEHTSELQSLMRSSYDVFCLKKKKHTNSQHRTQHTRTLSI